MNKKEAEKKLEEYEGFIRKVLKDVRT
jgi:N-acetylmuramic acid 6-phosphate (MurNAc-6-P) etherase